MAKTAKDNRANKIHALAEELDANVPRLAIKLPAGASAKAWVKLDGNPVDTDMLGSRTAGRSGAAQDRRTSPAARRSPR